MNEFALFANVEDPFGDTARAFRESIETILHAEALGFEQVWLTEHHFNAFSISASILPLLAYLAAKTTRIGLGAAAVLLPFHDPVSVAEDLSTIDALSEGRLLLGVGRGGPFPDQNRHFKVEAGDSRKRLYEALDLIEKVLARENVDHAGEHYQYKDLSVFPRPVRAALPIWLASMAEESLTLAASRGYGLMLPSAAPVSRIQTVLNDFQRHRSTEAPKEAHQAHGIALPAIVARYFLCGLDHRRARDEAAPFIRDFGSNMRGGLRRRPDEATPAGEASAEDAQRWLGNAIAGDPAACIEQCIALREAIGPHVLLLKPASYDPDTNRQSLTLFAEKVRPAQAA
jgi:alkanesulfonate monooxygenase SsuD/methylene tetrahydromethanopterin reductase-like flavin-dependent oxidoreductase (luciferase family)